MMERNELLERFASFVKTQLVPLGDPEHYPPERRDEAVRYQKLTEDARWVYRRLSAGGDPITILQRFHDSKVRTGDEGKALRRLIDEVRK